MRLILFRIKSGYMAYESVAYKKKKFNVVLYSSKREEIIFAHEFIFVFTAYIIGVTLSKKCCQSWGVQKK